MRLTREEVRIFWKRLFRHKDCCCDVYLLDGTIYRDINKETWNEHKFGILSEYCEVNDDRKLAKVEKYSPSKTLDKIIFQCSSCSQEAKCEKGFRGRNRRYER